MKIGYARISTQDQSLVMQVEALKEAGCDQVHEEIGLFCVSVGSRTQATSGL